MKGDLKMEITSETIKANYPQVWWAIYRQGFKEAQESPEIQEQMAKQHLERTLARPSSLLTVQASPQSQVVSKEQQRINRALGISAGDFTKYNRKEQPSQIGARQKEVNRLLGVSDEVFAKYA
jgi:hypothetical protein